MDGLALSGLETFLSLNYVRIAIPLFLVAIIAEALYSVWQRRGYYTLADSLCSIGCGILSQMAGAFFKVLFVGAYQLTQERWGIFDFARLEALPKLAAAFILFLGVDFCYYWFHRMAHIINLGWATHVVHHSSEEYNFSTALRQGAFQDFFSFGFYLPLALIGFPTGWFLALSSLNTTYQFWIHTKAVKKLPRFVEFWFNTPSHHRVHHGSNPCYIDRNHAGILIIWDRLFGSFAEERETPRYGITTPLTSRSPLWAQLHYWQELWQIARRSRRWRDKIQLWVRGPGWLPADVLSSDKKTSNRGALAQSLCAKNCTAIHALGACLSFTAALGGAVVLIFGGGWSLEAKLGITCFVVLGLRLTGAFLDGAELRLRLPRSLRKAYAPGRQGFEKAVHPETAQCGE